MKRIVIALLMSASLPSMAQSALKVNGQSVPPGEQKEIIQLLKTNGVKSSQAQTAGLNMLVKEKIIGQEAWRQKVAQSPLVKRQIAELRTKVYQEYLVRRYLKEHPVTESEMKQVYDGLKLQYDPREIKVRHILVRTEPEAKDLLYLIQAGEDMGKLAQKYTLDKGTASAGGLIPFTNVSRFSIPNFASTAAGLKKGQVLNRPFKSKEGFHIIKLEDSRRVPFPEYAAIQEDVKKRAEAIKGNEYITGLFRKAQVVGLNSPKKP